MSRRDPIQSIRLAFQSIIAESPAAGGVLLSFLKSDHQAALARPNPVVAAAPTKGKRGRPAGSKNQPKPNGQPAPAAAGAKGKPGPKPKAASPAPSVQSTMAQAAGAEKFDSIGE